MARKNNGNLGPGGVRSKKAYRSAPPRELEPHLSPKQTEPRDVGQFSGEGNPPLEKK